MQLDYNASKGIYILKVSRTEGVDIKALMLEHGLDLSRTATTAADAILFTREAYCAASFAKFASPMAAQHLGPITKEIEASWKTESKAHIACPPDRELWPFQRADIEYALRRRNTLVGDQPGLGKTPIAICYANEIRAKRVLVVCPASIRYQWVTRIREWTTLRWPVIIHPILKAANGTNPAAHYTIISYDLCRNQAILDSFIKEGKFDLVILDEVHYLKTSDSLRTRAIFGGGTVTHPVAENCGAILGLSGTPLLNRPREAYTVARALCWDSIDWMSEEKFKTRFNPSILIKGERKDGSEYRYVDERSGRHGELQNRLRGNFMVRHLKREVMPQLQMPIFDLIYVDETSAVKQALEAESLLDIDPEHLDGTDPEMLGHISTVRMMMGIAMAPQVAEYVDMLIDGGEEKLVVFAWHKEVLNILEQAWRKHGVLRVDGRTSPKNRQLIVNEFRANPKRQIFLGQTIAAGVGTDGLQDVAFHVLLAEPDWVPANNEQPISRLDRGGQRNQVQADIFVAPNSFSEKVLKNALRKNQGIHLALDRRYG